MRDESITVIGAGIVGLSAAVSLAEAGFAVRVASHRPGAESVSGVAGAIWLPYEAGPWARVRKWAQTTYQTYAEEIRDSRSGVGWIDLVYLHDGRPERPGWADITPGTERRPAAGFDGGLPAGYPEAFVARVPVIEPSDYLNDLAARLRRAGGVFEWLDEALAALEEAPGSGPVVNCAGLEAGALVGDSMVFPIRGQVVRVGPISTRRAVAADYGPLALSYVIPRSTDTILGGTATRNDHDRSERPAETRAIRARCAAMVPETRDAPTLGVAVGLRPGRPEVRLEADVTPSGRRVVHAYGHGGSGYTLCWGCAADIVDLLNAGGQ